MSQVWPTPVQMDLLRACFAPEAHVSQLPESVPAEPADSATLLLLALAYRRWPQPQNPLFDRGHRAYLSTWRTNRDRMAHLLDLTARLKGHGIRSMALKGAALALRHYRELGTRPMSDFDILIDEGDIAAAVDVLIEQGYTPEGGCSPASILRQSRVRHAWQFYGAMNQNCDLHWRPLSRCYSPDVAHLFWETGEAVRFGDRDILVPSPSDQLFHVCAHGLQWSWESQVRWAADAMTVLREPIDWDRVRFLAEQANMCMRLAAALAFLRGRFQAPVPETLPESLESAAPGWERREFRLLLKPCPLGFRDSLAWHYYHFLRIRPHDPRWRGAMKPSAFVEYIGAFLDASGPKQLCAGLLPELRARLGASEPGRAGRRSARSPVA